MAKTQHFITIRGHAHEWSFDVYVDPKQVQEWRADGVEIFEVENSIPDWVVDVGLTRVWCFLQHLFHLKNPL